MESSDALEIRIRISKDVFDKLASLAERKGYKDVSTYIEDLLRRHATGVESPKEYDLEKMWPRIERRIQDELNKSLSVIDSLRRQVSELYERLDHVESLVKDLSAKQLEAKPSGMVQRGKAYKTGIERLREDKILFESTLPPRIQRDAFFSYLEREGAVVLKLSRERIAVDREFWNEFKGRLFQALTSNKDEEIKQVLGEKGYALWRALYDDNLIIFDPKTKAWRQLFKDPA